jgi:hypothetical protein
LLDVRCDPDIAADGYRRERDQPWLGGDSKLLRHGHGQLSQLTDNIASEMEQLELPFSPPQGREGVGQ